MASPPVPGAIPEAPGQPSGSSGTDISSASANETGTGVNPQSTLPVVSTPKGGGAIKGIGEKFGTNPVTGTASMSIPIPLSPGRSGFGPSLSLGYDSGNGNGVWGFGWSLNTPAIMRKTDKGLPRYADADESDVFLISGAEDLVPVLETDGTRHADTATFPGFSVHRYRPRIEGLFARIERWADVATGETHWRSISRDNVTTLYGRTPESRIENGARTFEWLICESHDDRGNAIVYEYVPEDDRGVEPPLPGSAVRDHVRMRYLKRVLYGNRTSRLVQADASDWMFEAVLDYAEGHLTHRPPDPGVPADEQHHYADASVDASGTWPVRPDPFSSNRAGFEIRTHRRCTGVLMFHRIPDLGPDPYLVRSTEFDYHDLVNDGQVTPEDELAHQGSTRIASFLMSVTQSGYIRQPDGRYLRSTLPPVEFAYSKPTIDPTVHTLDDESQRNLPIGLDGHVYQWIDLDGVGLPGALTVQSGTWYWKANLGGGRLGPLTPLRDAPATVTPSTGRGQLLDLQGDGRLDAAVLDGPSPGFSSRTEVGSWTAYRALSAVPAVRFDDPNLRFVDLTSDGLADILVTEGDSFTWYGSLGEDGFDAGRRVPHPDDDGAGPRLVFADGEQAVYLADMSGDGLVDLVRIRNGQVAYWPSLGYGRFGSRIILRNSPWFDTTEAFDQRRIRLADIDGSNATDIIYLGRDGVRLYVNESGNRLTDPLRLRGFPPVTQFSAVQVADLLGNGTACLVWSSPAPADTRTPVRYIDLMGGTKPHLLIRSVNNLGSETAVEYAPSTRFYLDDLKAGRPWATLLPFPVHCVSRVETIDRISGNRFVSRFRYAHGYFDGFEREFRGFGRIEQSDTETYPDLVQGTAATNQDEVSHVPPARTVTWYHTGVFRPGEQVSTHLAAEYYREPGLTDAEASAMLLPDTVLPQGLDTGARREACRALKGAMLRQEVYADDGTSQAVHPYTVTEQNLTVEVLQQRGPNRHVVFFTHPREAISHHYERVPADPRTTHTFTLAVDEYGNVERTATVGYGRRAPDPDLSVIDQAAQARVWISAIEATWTNAVDEENDHRTPLPARSTSVELTGMAAPGPSRRYSFMKLDDAILDAVPIDYVITPTTGLLQKRIIDRTQHVYRADDLSEPLPVGALESRALSFESYRLAFTDAHVSAVFGGRVTDSILLGEGRYVHVPGEAGWWVPSGTTYFSPDTSDTAEQELAFAQGSFFLAHRYQNPFHTAALPTESVVTYDAHHLLPVQTEDALGNRSTMSQADYRVLQPVEVTDANGNRSAAAFDALGMIVATAMMGKAEAVPAEGDRLPPDLVRDPTAAELDGLSSDPLSGSARTLLSDATQRFVYNLHTYRRSTTAADPSPAWACTILRETHVSDPAPLRMQVSFAYSDGFDRQIQIKTMAEPDASGPRWAGSGWTVYNNKARPVRQYEPFFAPTHIYERETRAGVTPILCYDALGRMVAKVHPDHTWEKALFGPWQHANWDRNDTVLIANHAADPEVGGLLSRLPDADLRPTWYEFRTDPAFGPDRADRWPDSRDVAAQRRAAELAAEHAATPAVLHSDSLGRAALAVMANRFRYSNAPNGSPPTNETYSTRTVLDIEGHQLQVIDTLGRLVVRYDHDVMGRLLHLASMESGERWTLMDVAGHEIRTWDSRGHQQRTTYDALRRPVAVFLQEPGSAMEIMTGATVFGESVPHPEQRNLRGRAVELRDQAGTTVTDRYDFKGNIIRSGRQIVRIYDALIDWSGTVDLLPGIMWQSARVDALNRPMQEVAPHASQNGHVAAVVQRTYNEAGLFETADAWLDLSADPDGLLDPGTASMPCVTGVRYDAKGQRQQINYGNGAVTDYDYDPLTFRLNRLTTRRGSDTLQDLNYAYDPSGYVMSIRDDAQQQLFFRNAVVDPLNEYRYDATHRLIEATGREHLGQTGALIPHSYNDAGRVGLIHPGDGGAMGRYLERYRYDAVGSLLSMEHRGSDGANPGWTRTFSYSEPSQLEPSRASNRLTRSTVGGTTEVYGAGGTGYDQHGNLLGLPHLEEVRWDFRDQLRMTRRQAVNTDDTDGTTHAGERTWYVYDSAGQRVRKVTESSPGVVKESRLYVGSTEIFQREGGDPLLRQTFHLRDDRQRIAQVDLRLAGDEPGVPSRLTRYQFANRLGSVTLELDDTAQVLAYEEYTPYGASSYQAARGQIETPRYRFTGQERDAETGFTYHLSRYYLPWLGRWLSCDRTGLNGGTNLYLYADADPIGRHDRGGTSPKKQGQEGDVNRHGSQGLRGKGTPKQLESEHIDPIALQRENLRGPDGKSPIPPGRGSAIDRNQPTLLIDKQTANAKTELDVPLINRVKAEAKAGGVTAATAKELGPEAGLARLEQAAASTGRSVPAGAHAAVAGQFDSSFADPAISAAGRSGGKQVLMCVPDSEIAAAVDGALDANLQSTGNFTQLSVSKAPRSSIFAGNWAETTTTMSSQAATVAEAPVETAAAEVFSAPAAESFAAPAARAASSEGSMLARGGGLLFGAIGAGLAILGAKNDLDEGDTVGALLSLSTIGPQGIVTGPVSGAYEGVKAGGKIMKMEVDCSALGMAYMMGDVSVDNPNLHYCMPLLAPRIQQEINNEYFDGF
ncbi:RHS repeat-associated protein [Streptomyces sp. V4I8]|uniref:SpvB/TcaC N-terminal domain-containing protein n=1 Tax=Streptomyces sp. V4I8 TaxID=3156469 RepID=UPI0035197E22